MADAIIGREEELAAIQSFLAEVEQGPTALVLSGEAGIGKTVLWETGAESAHERFGRVLLHRGAEAEAGLAFTGLSDLLADVFEEAAPSLAPPRRRALEVALLLVEPGEAAPDPRAIGLALLDVLQVLAESRPVVVAVDDLQWVDPSSAAVLSMAFRRLRAARVGLLATERTAVEVPVPFELERSLPEERRRRLQLGPLSLGALHHLLKERLALELTRAELARVREATAGNPFFMLELGRELLRADESRAAGRDWRVPDSLHELLGGRLARLPEDTQDALIHAAALARPTVELVAAACGEGVLDSLEAAALEGVIDLDDSRIRFAHPLLVSICYEQASLRKRRAVHRALARTVVDVEERARHLALATDGPDAGIASELDVAAERAVARGATAAAAELSELAAELTPGDPALARRRRLQAADFHRLAGDPERAAAMLQQLLAEVPSGVERADVLLGLVMTHRPDIQTLIELCDQALAEAAGDNARSARILAFRSGNHLWEPDARAALDDARAALEQADLAGDPFLVAGAIARIGTAESYVVETTPGLLERGLEIEDRLGLALEYQESPRYALARHQMRLGEFERARALLEQLETKAVARGDEGTRVMGLWTLGLLEWLAGRWQLALEHTTAAYDLTELAQLPHGRGWVGRVKALVEADLGLLDKARASAEDGLAFSRATSREVYAIMTLGVLGRLELALGNLPGAGDYLRELPGRLLASGMNDPTQPLWADAIEVLVGLGELERGREYLERYEENAGRLGSPIATAGAARCRGLFLAAEGDLSAATEAFETSLDDAAPFPLERARTLLCLGVVRRQVQQKKAAREVLEQALAIFEELGARLWAEKTRAELRRISGRRAPSEELTETERRVAELAAQGRTNKEIAAELFMGVSTVEAHLSHVYRKLGIRSRTELGSQLAKHRAEAVQA